MSLLTPILKVPAGQGIKQEVINGQISLVNENPDLQVIH
jgi:hypothetical protein